MTRREKQIEALKKKKHYNNTTYETEREYLNALRKKVQKSLLNSMRIN